MTSDPRLQINGLINGNGRAPDVYRFLENGREYYAYKKDVVYPFPCDEREKCRLDQFYHLIHQIALRTKLHTAELPDRVQRQRPRILDVGHGTGIWVWDMGEKYPNMDVFGIDLIDNQAILDRPTPNVFFRTEIDFTSPNWGFSLNSFDLIRMCQLCGSVGNWLQQYQIVYRHLKPGTGFVEHIEIDWTPRYEHGDRLPSELRTLQQWWDCMLQASDRRPIAYREDTGDLLTRAGFVELTHKTIRIPLRSNSKDRRQAELRRYFVSFVGWPDQEEGVPRTFEALSLSLLNRVLRIPVDEIRSMCDALREIYVSDQYDIYHNIHIWTARKPTS